MEFIDILQSTFENSDYRRVIFTGSFCQLTIMSVSTGDFIEDELIENDKVFIVLHGRGQMFFTDGEGELKEGSCVGISAETKYRLVNTGDEDLKMIAVYAPAEFAEDEVDSSPIDQLFESPQGERF